MTPSELLALWRRYVSDTEATYLWSDDDAYAFMDEAQKEFARLTDCFPDTEAVTVTANSEWVTLPSYVTKIRSAKLASDGRTLKVLTNEQMDEGYTTDDYGQQTISDWESLTGVPTHLITGMSVGQGRLVGVPTTNDTLNLVVYRLPTEDIEDELSDFELTDSRHQRALRFWMAAQAYGYQDSEGWDPQAAERNELKFYNYCDQVKRDLQRLRKPAGTVRYGGL